MNDVDLIERLLEMAHAHERAATPRNRHGELVILGQHSATAAAMSAAAQRLRELAS